jgi:hypothetical protein
VIRVVPEPHTALLVALGAAGLLVQARKWEVSQ